MTEKRAAPSQLLSVGAEAPGFSLPNQAGESVTLDAFRGKVNVVLVFYPGDSTPGCTKQLCAIRDQFGSFDKADVVVFGVNPQSAESHERFVRKRRFPFSLLVDQGKKVASAYGCKGVLTTKRTVYGINRDGIIVFARRGMPSNEEILNAFKA